jgi:hypothetical protein
VPSVANSIVSSSPFELAVLMAVISATTSPSLILKVAA